MAAYVGKERGQKKIQQIWRYRQAIIIMSDGYSRGCQDRGGKREGARETLKKKLNKLKEIVRLSQKQIT